MKQTKNDPLGLTRFALRAFQIASLLPVLYVVAASVYPYGLTHAGPMNLLCGAAFAALPRTEVLALSLLFRWTKSEMIALVIALPVISLALCILSERLLKKGGQTAKVLRLVLAGFLAADLVLRFLPFAAVGLGWGATLFGAAFQALWLGLILWDLKPEKPAA